MNKDHATPMYPQVRAEFVLLNTGPIRSFIITAITMLGKPVNTPAVMPPRGMGDLCERPVMQGRRYAVDQRAGNHEQEKPVVDPGKIADVPEPGNVLSRAVIPTRAPVHGSVGAAFIHRLSTGSRL